MAQSIYGLREIASILQIPNILKVATMTGVKTAYRVTVQHKESEYSHIIATLRFMRSGEAILETVYPGCFGNQPLTRRFSRPQFETFNHALLNLRFDRLADQTNIPFYGVDIWLVERASGGYEKNILLSPDTASDTHARLISLFRIHIPELTRQIKL